MDFINKYDYNHVLKADKDSELSRLTFFGGRGEVFLAA